MHICFFVLWRIHWVSLIHIRSAYRCNAFYVVRLPLTLANSTCVRVDSSDVNKPLVFTSLEERSQSNIHCSMINERMRAIFQVYML